MPDGFFSEFSEFLSQKEFDYATDGERMLEDLQSELSSISGASEGIDELQKKVKSHKKELFNSERSMIEESLFFEILSRYKGQKSRTKAELDRDHQLKAAIDLITSPKDVSSLLSGN